MADRLSVQLGAATYRVPRLNLGEMRELHKVNAEFLAKPEATSLDLFEYGIAVARLVFGRAEPAIADFDRLECAPGELRAANEAVLQFSGLKPGKAPASEA
jgi:hypothetical protein